jgi:SPP1 family predicted phage head-tail adaptor
MQPGKLDRRITIQRQTVTQDSYGQDVVTWTDLATVWAEVGAVRGIERFAAMQTVAEVDTRFVIRHRDVGPKDRISYGGRTYDIKSVIEIGRREALEIHAQARAE